MTPGLPKNPEDPGGAVQESYDVTGQPLAAGSSAALGPGDASARHKHEVGDGASVATAAPSEVSAAAEQQPCAEAGMKTKGAIPTETMSPSSHDLSPAPATGPFCGIRPCATAADGYMKVEHPSCAERKELGAAAVSPPDQVVTGATHGCSSDRATLEHPALSSAVAAANVDVPPMGSAASAAATVDDAAGAPGAAGGVVRGLPSLQECCMKVLHRHMGVYNCLELLSLARGMEGLAFSDLAAVSHRYAIDSFETLQGVRSESELRAALTDEVYEGLAAAHAERVVALAAMRRVGRVVERAAAVEAAARESTSVAGRPVCFPPETLQAGVAWPAGVDSAVREEWLSAEDFERLFGGLSWERYQKLPGWRRAQMKKEAGLF